MLVLTRKPGEELVIGDNIRVTVVAIRGKLVRIGLTAPADVPIQRAELSQTADAMGTPAVGPPSLETEP
jgi:carbon storage regulator